MQKQFGGVKRIPLNRGLSSLVEEEDFNKVSLLGKWGCMKGNKYAGKRVGGKIIYMHRFIMDCPLNMEVDHINGDGLDNRKSNLRICTSQQNRYNHKLMSTNKSGYNGVYFHKGMKKWETSISVKDKTIHLGFFINIEDAAKAHDKYVKKYRGKFARMNIKGGQNGR